MATKLDGRVGIGQGVKVTVSATGASEWYKTTRPHNNWTMMCIPSTATTAFSVALQGTLTTESTTPRTILHTTALTGVMVVSTIAAISRGAVTYWRTNTTSLSSGTVDVYVTALGGD